MYRVRTNLADGTPYEAEFEDWYEADVFADLCRHGEVAGEENVLYVKVEYFCPTCNTWTPAAFGGGCEPCADRAWEEEWELQTELMMEELMRDACA
jgi:hypothetical protein